MQEFPADNPGTFRNCVTLAGGALCAELTAEHSQAREDRLNLEFLDTVFHVGPWGFTKARAVPVHPCTLKRSVTVAVACGGGRG